MLARLLQTSHSWTQFYIEPGDFDCDLYHWPGSHLLSQPGRPLLSKGAHIDAEVSADSFSSRVSL